MWKCDCTGLTSVLSTQLKNLQWTRFFPKIPKD